LQDGRTDASNFARRMFCNYQFNEKEVLYN